MTYNVFGGTLNPAQSNPASTLLVQHFPKMVMLRLLCVCICVCACVQLWDRLLKALVRDVFKDNMDTAFEHLTGGGKGGKVICVPLLQRYQVSCGTLFTQCISLVPYWQHIGQYPATQFFYRPDAFPATQPTASKHQRPLSYTIIISFDNSIAADRQIMVDLMA